MGLGQAALDQNALRGSIARVGVGGGITRPVGLRQGEHGLHGLSCEAQGARSGDETIAELDAARLIRGPEESESANRESFPVCRMRYSVNVGSGSFAAARDRNGLRSSISG